MPYSLNPKDGQFEVVNDTTNEVVGTHPTRGQALAQQRALYANVPDAKTKADYPWDQCMADQMEEYGDEETARKVCGSIRAKYGEYRALTDKERGDIESELKVQRKGLVDRILTWFKEGRRNSNTDAGRLQQIHDLSVENGATCPMIYKQADGKLRWVLFSTNSFEDRDREIVSQKSLEADVDRMDQVKQYGPLRWWHVGIPNVITKEAGPGLDIGDCDFVATHEHVRIDSGTFRNERIGEAIKEHADDFGASIGFFHPLDEPDSEGVYHNIHSFERSLLPRGKASNSLTALAVIDKESDMATLKDKLDDFAARFGNDQETVKQFMAMAEQIEQKAKERGLRQKEMPPVSAATETPTPPAEEPQKDEPANEAVDYEAMAKGLQPFIEKMIEEKMAGTAKEIATKEAGLQTSLDELTKQVKELIGDQPRGFFNGFRPSQSGATLLKDASGNPIALKDAPQGDSMDTAIDQLIKGAQNQFMQPTPPVAAPPVTP